MQNHQVRLPAALARTALSSPVSRDPPNGAVKKFPGSQPLGASSRQRLYGRRLRRCLRPCSDWRDGPCRQGPSIQRLVGRTLPARSVHTATAGTEAAALALTTQRAALADPQHRRRFTRRVLEHVPAIHRSRGPVARAAQHGWKTVRVHAVSTGGSGLASTRHRTAAGGSKHQGADGRGKAERVEGKRETNESDVAPQHVVSRQSSARWRSHAGRHDLAVLEDQITIHH